METFSEFMQRKESQDAVSNMVAEIFRERGVWGSRGLYSGMGEKLGYSGAYVSGVFNGKRKMTEGFARKLCGYLGLPIESLMTGKPEPIVQGRKTHEFVVKLLQEAVAKSSQNQVAKNTGLPLQSVQRYLKGLGEPNMASLQKLADYFGETFIIEVKPREQSLAMAAAKKAKKGAINVN